MFQITLMAMQESSGSDIEYETVSERHDSHWLHIYKNFDLEGAELLLHSWSFSTSIHSYAINPRSGGRGLSLGPPDTRLNVGRRLKLRGCTTPLSINETDPLHIAFLGALVALEGMSSIAVPFDLMMEISSLRIRNKTEKMSFG